MQLKFALAFIALSLFFISLLAHADDCSDALIAESCASQSGAAQSKGKNGEHAYNRTRSKAHPMGNLAKAPVAADSNGIAAPAPVER